MPAEILYAGRDPFSRKVIIDKGAQHGVRAGQPGDRRGRRHRPGDARASRCVSRSDAAHRQGPGDPGAGGAQRPARGRLRRRRERHARAALHGGQRRHPERRRAGHLGHRRHLPAGPAGGHGGAHRARRGLRVRAHRSARRPPASSAAARCWCSPSEARAAAAARGRSRRARASAPQDAAGRDARTAMRLRRAPQRILLPVRGELHRRSRSRSRCCSTSCPGETCALAPDFVALVLAFWCVRQPRLVGIGIAWLLGLLIDVGNGVLLGQHALAYSVLAFGAIALSRRILWFPLVEPGAARRCCCCCARRRRRRWCAPRRRRRVSRLVASSSARSSAPRSGRC